MLMVKVNGEANLTNDHAADELTRSNAVSIATIGESVRQTFGELESWTADYSFGGLIVTVPL